MTYSLSRRGDFPLWVNEFIGRLRRNPLYVMHDHWSRIRLKWLCHAPLLSNSIVFKSECFVKIQRALISLVELPECWVVSELLTAIFLWTFMSKRYWFPLYLSVSPLKVPYKRKVDRMEEIGPFHLRRSCFYIHTEKRRADKLRRKYERWVKRFQLYFSYQLNEVADNSCHILSLYEEKF